MCFQKQIGSSGFSVIGSTFLSYSGQNNLIHDLKLVYVHVKSHLRAKYAARFTDFSKAHDSHIYIPLLLIVFVHCEAKVHNKKAGKVFMVRFSKTDGAKKCLAGKRIGLCAF